MQGFLTSIKGGEAGISQKFLDQPPTTTIGNYCEALRWTFYHSKWSGGYGGKKWGVVTDCLCALRQGRVHRRDDARHDLDAGAQRRADIQQRPILRRCIVDADPHPRRAALGPNP